MFGGDAGFGRDDVAALETGGPWTKMRQDVADAEGELDDDFGSVAGDGLLQDAGGGVLVLDVLLRMAFSLLVVQAQALGGQWAALLGGEAAGGLVVACLHGRVELGGDLGWGVAVEAEKRKEEGGEGDQDGGGLTEFHNMLFLVFLLCVMVEIGFGHFPDRLFCQPIGSVASVF